MTTIGLLNQTESVNKFSGLFLKELEQQLHLQDKKNCDQNAGNNLLLDFFSTVPQPENKTKKKVNSASAKQLLISAFYKAIAKTIEEKSGYTTQAFVNFKNNSFSSAVIFCGGVLVVYSLRNSQQQDELNCPEKLAKQASQFIDNAINKASLYLDITA